MRTTLTAFIICLFSLNTGIQAGIPDNDMPSSSILEPMVLLYRHTGEKRYLGYARYIVAQWETEAGPGLIHNALDNIPVAERFPVQAPDTFMQEKYRPQFHFSPPAHWMNDPNGMVFYKGEYHLFYQYYPDSNVWGPMHWGHAISTDMVHWKYMPVALSPDSLGYIFSGSAVADLHNTSGLGTEENPPLVAIFTYHDPVGEKKGRNDFQQQGLAYSIDSGRHWTKYSQNPVIKNPGKKDFRDPKVFWHQESKKWVMVLAVANHVEFYGSPDLIRWNYLSEFGAGTGAHGGVWECPDMFGMQAEGSGETKWILLVSINPGGPNGGSATQYFTGNFDGTVFRNESFENKWIDSGRDNYAGVTWSNVPAIDGRRLFLGWMSNWQYATVVPTYVWRSAMTIPRELYLMKSGNSYILGSRPARELTSLRGETFLAMHDVQFDGTRELIANNKNLRQCEMYFSFNMAGSKSDTIAVVLENDKAEKIILGYSQSDGEIFVDRTHSGLSGFSTAFAGISQAPYKAGGNLSFHIFSDASSIELFVDDGRLVMTHVVFPTENFSKLSLYSSNGAVMAEQVQGFQLKSAW